jgi:hypothetical protein
MGAAFGSSSGFASPCFIGVSHEELALVNK